MTQPDRKFPPLPPANWNGLYRTRRFRRTDAIWLAVVFALLVLTLVFGHYSGWLTELRESYEPPSTTSGGPRDETDGSVVNRPEAIARFHDGRAADYWG